MQIPEDMIRRACEVLGDDQAEDEATRDLATRLLAVIPSIRAYERGRIAEVIQPGRLDQLAEWADRYVGVTDGQAQRDLRMWAQVLRATPESPAAMLLEELPS